MRLAVAALAAFLILPAPATAGGQALLPDLRQETPYDLSVATDGRRFHLGFTSVVYNYGDGPLRVEGERESTRDPTMTATQVIDSSDGSRSRVPGAGRMRFVDSITHRHWHYLDFDTYSLLRADGTRARGDRKTGFCLGDRLDAPIAAPLPAKPPSGGYAASNCGYDSPDLLRVEEGISVGYGDDYGPHLEGQFVDITGLPAGRYTLLHRVNPDGALREKDTADNAASVLIDLSWRRGAPRVVQVARCPLSASCPTAPALRRARATRFARTAFRRAFRRQAADVSCREPADGAWACSGSWAGGSGTVTVRYSVSRGRLYWTYEATSAGGPPKRGRIAVGLGRKTRVPVGRAGSFRRGKLAYCPLIERGSAASG